jgi:hypothetical protein
MTHQQKQPRGTPTCRVWVGIHGCARWSDNTKTDQHTFPPKHNELVREQKGWHVLLEQDGLETAIL